MNLQEMINHIAAGDSMAAKESIENALSAKAFDALQSRKQEIASTLFGGQNQESEEITDNEEAVYEEELDEATEAEDHRNFHDRVNETLKSGSFSKVPGYKHRDNSRDHASDMNHHGWIHTSKDDNRPYSVHAHRDSEGSKLQIHPDVRHSNEYSPHQGLPSGEKIHKKHHDEAKKIADNINNNTPHKAKVVTHESKSFNSRSGKFEMGKHLPHVEVRMAKNKQEPEKASSSSSSPGSSQRSDPRSEFMSRPGEVARQTRVARSAFSSSFGGDASNYRR
jgi:hypothetical protein